MKKTIIFLSLILVFSCKNPTNNNEMASGSLQLEKDLEMYQNVWNSFLAGDTSVVNNKNFTEDVVIVTSNGDLVGIDACKEFPEKIALGIDSKYNKVSIEGWTKSENISDIDLINKLKTLVYLILFLLTFQEMVE